MKRYLLRFVCGALVCALALTTVCAASFADMENHWAKKEVEAATELGLFRGVSETEFQPDRAVTRAQFVTVLWRMAGKPSATAAPFADTAMLSEEFKSAIAWGYANGIVNGVSETAFDPNGSLTREAAMKILYAYAGGVSGEELLLTAVYDGLFSDSDEVSSWAKTSMYWGIYNKVISGVGEDLLNPKGIATRAQLAKILVSYLAEFKEEVK